MHIKLVQKIKLDGNPCRKSARVLNDIKKLNLLEKIDEIIDADERNKLNSEGFNLASQYQISSAPFFIVENDEGSTRVYAEYYHFMKDVFQISISEKEEISEIMAQNPDLDYI